MIGNLTAEAAMLGAALEDPSWFDRVPIELFAESRVRKAWAYIATLAAAGTRCDLITARAHLEGVVSEPGTLLADALESSARTVPAAALEAMRSDAQRRELGGYGRALQSVAEQPGEELPMVVAQVQDGLESLSDPAAAAVHRLPTLQRMGLAAIRSRAQDEIPGWSTGFRALDDLTGGLEPGMLTILAARTSIGKSALAHQIALTVADAGQHVGLITPEMSRGQVLERMLALRSGVDTGRIRRNHLGLRDWAALEGAGRQMPDLWLHDRPGVTVPEIIAVARREHGRRPLDLLIVDHLGYLADPPLRGEMQVTRLGRLVKALKAIGYRLDCAVLALAQLNRGSEDATEMHRPGLTSLRESGQLEEDADTIWLLHKTTRESAEATLIVAKDRPGPLGDVPLTWDGPTCRFTPRSPA